MVRFLGLTALILGCTCLTASAFVTLCPASATTFTTKAGTTKTISSHAFSKEYTTNTATLIRMSAEGQEDEKSNLPFWLDIGTKGGAVFYSLVLFIVPLIGYNIVTTFFGVDEIEAGKWIGVGFTGLATFAWVSTYIFRVATKDMTYVSTCLHFWYSRRKQFLYSPNISPVFFSCLDSTRRQAKQLKDYENAVIAKRLEELDDDEIQALVEEIDRDDF